LKINVNYYIHLSFNSLWAESVDLDCALLKIDKISFKFANLFLSVRANPPQFGKEWQGADHYFKLSYCL
jgi:hypothetical protein